jgi:hypothetical protein
MLVCSIHKRMLVFEKYQYDDAKASTLPLSLPNLPVVVVELCVYL